MHLFTSFSLRLGWRESGASGKSELSFVSSSEIRFFDHVFFFMWRFNRQNHDLSIMKPGDHRLYDDAFQILDCCVVFFFFQSGFIAFMKLSLLLSYQSIIEPFVSAEWRLLQREIDPAFTGCWSEWASSVRPSLWDVGSVLGPSNTRRLMMAWYKRGSKSHSHCDWRN